MYPFHMPGHKRALHDRPLSGAYESDITEIDGFDVLQHPAGMIKDLQERAAAYYGFDHAFILVNGSTSGILSAISSTVKHRQKLLMARNSHKSAYDAVYLGELDTGYFYPSFLDEYGIFGAADRTDIEKELKKDKAVKAVFVTSPTYDGILSDIDAIADTVHSYGIPLIVDAAHGAHLDVSKKADIQIVSLHKTLPAFTSSALCLVNKGLVDPDNIKFYINIFQTSSPSYIIMSGIEECFDILESEGRSRKKALNDMLSDAYRQFEKNTYIKAIDESIIEKYHVFDKDRSKICIYDKSNTLSGRRIYDILRERYHIQPEAAYGRICLCLCSIMDSREGFDRLIKAVGETDEYLRSGQLT